MLLQLPKHITFFRRCFSKLSYIHKVGTEPLLSITSGQLIEQAANNYPKRLAIISCQDNRQFTFEKLLENVDNVAAGFKKLNINKGDYVAIWAPNTAEWIFTSFACARLGAIIVQFNHSYKKNELLYSLNKTKAKVLVCGKSTTRQPYYDIIQGVDSRIFENGTEINSKLLPALRTVITMDEEKKGTYLFNEISKNNTDEDLKWVKDNQSDIQFDDPVNVQLSSGTTGTPKAVIVTHQMVINNSYNFGKRLEMHKKHHIICCQLPLFHTFGTVAGIYASLHFGATVVLPSDFYNSFKSLKAVKEHKCTIILGTPTMHVDMIEQQKRHNFDIKPDIITTGGGPTTPQLHQDIYKYLQTKFVHHSYGMTESTAVFFQMYLQNSSINYEPGAVGQISNHVEVKVIDERGKVVPFGISGELCCRGYLNMLEYLHDPEKTAEVMGSDRWLKTGDKFILYEDGNGKIIGRIKEIIIRGGENIYPGEIESCLSTHPKLIDCQVIGLPHERLGEEICACVRLKAGEKITLNEVREFCKEHMAHYKIPSKIHVLEEYPKSTVGKIRKFKLVELVNKEYNL